MQEPKEEIEKMEEFLKEEIEWEYPYPTVLSKLKEQLE